LKPITAIKSVVFAAALVPAAALVYDYYTENLTANPLDYITDQTGTWALAFIVISLCVTPLRRFTGWNQIIRLRRMLGLFAFFYALLHLLTWIVLGSFFDVQTMVEDVAMRPFITIGMAAFLILLALAVTSNQWSIRKLGRRWQTLHRLVYAAAIGAVVHFWWSVKADITEPRRWAIAVAVLLSIRVWWMWAKRKPVRRVVASPRSTA
jgi:sulfoxide reductase heme-binding subunit YedZ